METEEDRGERTEETGEEMGKQERRQESTAILTPVGSSGVSSLRSPKEVPFFLSGLIKEMKVRTLRCTHRTHFPFSSFYPIRGDNSLNGLGFTSSVAQ